MKNINIQCYFDERKNLTEEEKNNLKRKLLYSRKPVNFLVYRFIETLEKDKNINLNLFYKNLVDLEIIIDDSRIKSTGKLYKKEGVLLAYYNAATNTLVLPSNFRLVDIYHELFHVASTKKELNDILQSGLYYSDENIQLNDFFNEGYTEMLIKRYFNLELDDIYKENVHTAKLFEDIFGKQELLDCYFTANFEFLINEFLKYENENNVYKFMQATVNKNLKYMKYFLKDIYIKALYKKFFNNEITQEQFEYKIAYFFKRFKFENLGKECELILDNYKDNIKMKYENIYINKNSDKVLYVKK